MEAIQLPFPTNLGTLGPRICSQHSECVIEYEVEAKVNKIVSVVFKEVLACKFQQSICSERDDIMPSCEMQMHDDSAWLAEIVARWRLAVGWQDREGRLGGAKRFKEYRMFFDDHVSVRLIASGFTVASNPTK